MRIKKMTATFGKLEGAVLELEEGLNILQAPNEGGKSTWCAFLRSMFYGIPTRERDTRTSLAEKNRYAPWSGSPMAGEMTLAWRGRDITLRRFAKGNSPFGGFEAVDAATGEAVDGLTGENCGEVLLGVGREVFERSAFVGQTGLGVDGDPELERRIAALVSSGEEEVSFSQTEKTLKSWLNRRRHNKTGLIPKLEEEASGLDRRLAEVRQNARQLAEAGVQLRALEAQAGALEEEQRSQKARMDWARAEQYRSAVRELETARAERTALEREAGPLPGKEELRKAQGELVYLNTLNANLREAKRQLAPAREAVDAAENAAADPLFPGLEPEEARRRAGADAARVEDLEAGRGLPGRIAGLVLLPAGLLFAAGGLLLGGRLFPLLAGASALSLAGGALLLLLSARRRRAGEQERQRLLSRYGAASPAEILSRAESYRAAHQAVEEARRRAEAVEGSIRELSGQKDRLWEGLLSFVHTFAPAATDVFGVSAALSRALGMDERLATARVREEGARKLVASIPMPDGGLPAEREAPAPPPVSHTPQQTAAALAAVKGELGRVREALSLAQGRRTALGDLEELEHQRESLAAALDRRRTEYRALSLALEVLGEANAALQARFSPELNRRAGELFSALTGGRYEAVALTRDFAAAARESGGVLPRRALSLSRGTVDQLYLAVRLAVCEMALPAEDPAPLVLDDALSDFDDERMARALACLQALSRKRQILLFTCHSRERAALEGEGA